MIIYGTRMYGKKNVVNGWGYCTNCDRYLKHSSYNGRKWGHLYFIPLIPDGPHVRVLKECGKCSNGLHIPETEVPAMLDDLRQSCDKALAALIAGQSEFDDGGETVSCTACITGSVELLYCLQAEDYVNLLLSALQEKGFEMAYHMVMG